MEWIIDCADKASPDEIGAKGHALAAAQRIGIRIPPWFALTPAAAIACRTPAGDFVLAPELQVRIAVAVEDLCRAGELVAVRSSAVDEDGAMASFAGQLESFLFVPPQEVAARILDVWRSAFTARVLAYRLQHGLSGIASAPAVLVQRMINADAAGVAFSSDPVSGRRAVAVVAAVSGVGSTLVSGDQNADTWHIARSGMIESRAVAGHKPCICDSQALDIAALARRCARHFGRPQDIEWALADGMLWLLQSRPITSLSALTDPDGTIAIWDSSNIGESYSGVTTPLTFSYIRRGYEHAYRELCRLGGVDAATIREHDDVFRRMIGLISGRVHYNLLGWYRLLALTPGFERNRRFLDEMLGIRGQIPEGVIPSSRHIVGRTAGLLRAARQIVALVVNHCTADRRNQRFLRRLDSALAQPLIAFEDMRADELAEHFRALERELLSKWDAPLVNDFLAMIFHGMLRQMIERWFGEADRPLANDLLCGEPGIISVEPVHKIRHLARLARDNGNFVALLCSSTTQEILPHARANTAFSTAYNDYIERFGDRCIDELKLESATLRDDPLPLLRAIGHFASSAAPEDSGNGLRSRKNAERRAHHVLARSPLRRLLFGWVLRNARARVRDRENLRFERTRLFGRARSIFVEIGKRFHEIGMLRSHRDVFWLELDEILGFIDGTATCTNLQGLADLRRTEFERYRNGEVPGRRFETRGAVHHAVRVRAPEVPVAHDTADERVATGCCPGHVRGRARVVRAPEHAQLYPGEILVAERTDPGWVMLFASAGGLVIEHGSLLSHAAIVARELGIPAVIGVADACQWLADGDCIEIDGAAGIVRRLTLPPGPGLKEVT